MHRGKGLCTVGSNYYYIDFVSSTSCSASRLVTPVKIAPLEVSWTAKTIYQSSNGLRIKSIRFLAFKNALIYRKRRTFFLAMLLPPSWSWLADSKKYLGTAHKIRSKDHIDTPSQNIQLGQHIYKIKSEAFSFLNLAQLLKSFRSN